ncbi:hypothetical protein HYW41_01100 [Candidatus Daviesbacteria bacterium]|nr:hypothetical protein [Candidatus Daviesbacteria bacterium]MBI2596733.1 hypothetical protein [Candidatus Daviesbacteria bacterium]
MGYINKEVLQKTKDKGFVYFWSRSKNRIWRNCIK